MHTSMYEFWHKHTYPRFAHSRSDGITYTQTCMRVRNFTHIPSQELHTAAQTLLHIHIHEISAQTYLPKICIQPLRRCYIYTCIHVCTKFQHKHTWPRSAYSRSDGIICVDVDALLQLSDMLANTCCSRYSILIAYNASATKESLGENDHLSVG